MDLLLICESLRAGSTNEAVLATAAELATGAHRVTLYRGLMSGLASPRPLTADRG